MRKKHLLSVLLCCTSLVACSGGGGNIEQNLASINADPGTPAPTPDPGSPSDFESGEYLANWGLEAVNPIPAWEADITGQGVIVAVIDSGIDDTHTNLDANIHPASTYTGDYNGQGTFIAGLIAGERNTVGTHGVAYDAQILAIQSATSGSQIPTSDQLAASIDYAVANGADVINISVGGVAAPNAALLTALENAALADIVVVFSAGDTALTYDKAVFDFWVPETPRALAMTATLDIANGQFLIVGASDKADNPIYFEDDLDDDLNDPDFWGGIATNRAGETGAAYYLLAPGLDIYSTRSGGANLYEFRNDSPVAAAMVSAAAALLKQHFPNLTAAEIVNILVTSATDITTPGWLPVDDFDSPEVPPNAIGWTSTIMPGVDELYGHGLLNIGAAFAPIGTNSVAIRTTNGWITSDLDDAGLVSGGMFGDGISVGFGQGAIFLDDYDRAYTTSFGNNIIEANPTIDFGTRFNTARDYRHADLALSPDFYLSVSADYGVAPDPYLEDILGLREDDSVLADNVNFRLTKGVGKQSAVAMSVGGSLSSVLSFGAQDTGFGNSTHLSSGMNDPWTSVNRSSNYGDGQRVGFIHNLRDDLSLSVGISSDVVAAPNYAGLAEFGSDATRKVIVTQLKGSKGRLGWKTTAGLVSEEGMVLDSHSTGVLGLGSGADTTFFALGTEYALTDRIRAFGRVGQSSTRIDESDLSAFSQFGTLQASHFAAGVSLARAFSPMGSLSLSVSQPLRLERGVASMNIASSYDYTTETPNFTNQVNGLTPTGRELDLEAAYRYGLGNNASLTANILYQSNPGHVADRDSVISFMLAARSSF